MAGNNVRRYFPGDRRACPRCDSPIVVTESMCRRSKYTCGPCESAAAVAWARRNRDRKRAANNAAYRRSSGSRAARTSQYRDRHPDRKAAHQAVQTAIRNGTLVRQPCEVCGNPKSHGHHADYSKTLVVSWLCHSHHMALHNMLAERAKKGGAN